MAKKIQLTPGSPEWDKMRRNCTTPIPGKFSALYYLNDIVLGHGELVPQTPRAHYAMCLFSESATGIKAIDKCRIKLILVPRGLGKSTLITKGRTIQRLLAKDDYSVGLANEKVDNAVGFLSQIKTEFESNTLLQTLFPERIPNFQKRETTWAADRIELIRKKYNRMSPSVLATGVGATVTGVHMAEWILDDVISQNAAEAAHKGNFAEIESTNRWVVRLQPLLQSPKRDPILVIGCIEESQPVLMADGTWKPVKDVQVGDMVWACKKDGSEGFKAREVTGVWPQGESDIVEIDIAGRQVKCTSNHPFLTARGRGDGVNRSWHEAGDLAGRRTEVFMSQVDGSDTPHEHAWLLGFMIGDGWNTRVERSYQNAQGETRSNGTTYSVFFSPGVEEALNQKVIEQLNSLSDGPKVYKTTVGTYRIDSTQVGKILESLGLTPKVGAARKGVPEWIFQGSVATRRAFLRGLGDADGCWQHENRFALETASETLAYDVHRLAMSCGCRPTKVTSRTRISQPPRSPQPIEATVWHVGVNFCAPDAALRKHRTKSVRDAGRAQVYDLTVEDGECAYVANGLVSANTRWWEGDTYEWIEEFFGHDEPREEYTWTLTLPDGEVQTIKLIKRGEIAIFKRSAIENGASIFPERYTLEDLQEMQREDPVFFAGQYLLEPTAGAASEFQADWLRYYEWDGNLIRFRDRDGRLQYTSPREMVTLQSVDPAISDSNSAARSALPVTGINASGIFLLEDTAQKGIGPFDLSHRIIDQYLRFRCRKTFLETIVYQKALMEVLAQVSRERDAGDFMSTIEEIKSHGKQSKDFRIYALEPFFKRGNFYVHRSHSNFLTEYLGFPRSKFRDLLDSLSFQVNEWQRLMSQLDPKGPFDLKERDRRQLERYKQSITRGGGY